MIKNEIDAETIPVEPIVLIKPIKDIKDKIAPNFHDLPNNATANEPINIDDM